MTLLDNVKLLCQKRGISVKELEAALGMGNGSIYRWKKHIPSVNSVDVVARYFGSSVSEIIGDKYGGVTPLSKGGDKPMSKVTGPLEVIDFCANQACQGEILFSQRVVKHGKDLYCGNNCLCEGIGAVVIKADDNLEGGDVAEHENDPTG